MAKRKAPEKYNPLRIVECNGCARRKRLLSISSFLTALLLPHKLCREPTLVREYYPCSYPPTYIAWAKHEQLGQNEIEDDHDVEGRKLFLLLVGPDHFFHGFLVLVSRDEITLSPSVARLITREWVRFSEQLYITLRCFHGSFRRIESDVPRSPSLSELGIHESKWQLKWNINTRIREIRWIRERKKRYRESI